MVAGAKLIIIISKIHKDALFVLFVFSFRWYSLNVSPSTHEVCPLTDWIYFEVV